jgi:hypothetical protein
MDGAVSRPEFFRALPPPRAPAALRSRVLVAVAARANEEDNLLDRLWRSRTWWLGWAGAVVLLVAAEDPAVRSPSLVQLQRLELERLAHIEAVLEESILREGRAPRPAIEPGWSGV